MSKARAKAHYFDPYSTYFGPYLAFFSFGQTLYSPFLFQPTKFPKGRISKRLIPDKPTAQNAEFPKDRMGVGPKKNLHMWHFDPSGLAHTHSPFIFYIGLFDLLAFDFLAIRPFGFRLFDIFPREL